MNKLLPMGYIARMQEAWGHRPSHTDAILTVAAAAMVGGACITHATLLTKWIVIGVAALAAYLFYRFFSTDVPGKVLQSRPEFLINFVLKSPLANTLMGRVLTTLTQWPTITHIVLDDCTVLDTIVPTNLMETLHEKMEQDTSAVWGVSKKGQVFAFIRILEENKQIAYIMITCPTVWNGKDITVRLLRADQCPSEVDLVGKDTEEFLGNLERLRTSFIHSPNAPFKINGNPCTFFVKPETEIVARSPSLVEFLTTELDRDSFMSKILTVVLSWYNYAFINIQDCTNGADVIEKMKNKGSVAWGVDKNRKVFLVIKAQNLTTGQPVYQIFICHDRKKGNEVEILSLNGDDLFAFRNGKPTQRAILDRFERLYLCAQCTTSGNGRFHQNDSEYMFAAPA